MSSSLWPGFYNPTNTIWSLPLSYVILWSDHLSFDSVSSIVILLKLPYSRVTLCIDTATTQNLKRQSEMYTSRKLKLKWQLCSCWWLLCALIPSETEQLWLPVFSQTELINRNLLSWRSDPLSLTSIYFVYGLLNETEKIKYSSLIVSKCTAQRQQPRANFYTFKQFEEAFSLSF